jgi:hypothetical protein
LLFIALDRAGTHAGAWPLIPGQLVALLVIAPFAYRGVTGSATPSRSALALMLGAGFLSGIANLLFLAATGAGELAIVAVLTSLYPAATVCSRPSRRSSSSPRGDVDGALRHHVGPGSSSSFRNRGGSICAVVPNEFRACGSPNLHHRAQSNGDCALSN